MDNDDDRPNVDVELLTPPEEGNHSKKRDPSFEYNRRSRKPALVDEDYVSQFLSPGAAGSRLSSVTEFTDVPPGESSNCATSDDEDHSDHSEEV